MENPVTFRGTEILLAGKVVSEGLTGPAYAAKVREIEELARHLFKDTSRRHIDWYQSFYRN